jgi:lipoyl(octanoyl) transferase
MKGVAPFQDQPMWCARLGLRPYPDALALQKRLEAARQDERVPDVLLLLEHPPTYTRGRRATPDELPMGEDWYRAQGIDVFDTDRGGRVTYHGPGQLVGYPVMSLRPYGDDVHEYIRRMERVVVSVLGSYGIEAGTVEGLTGVWTADRRKIGSIGIHVSRGVTTHGFAINVNNDLQPFEWVVPCGIDHCRMTSVSRELGRALDMVEFEDRVRADFGRVYGRVPEHVEADRLEAAIEMVAAA